MRNASVQEGEFITDNNVTTKASVVVLGANVASELFTSGQDPVGQTMRINNISFKVVGVLTAKGGGGMGNQDDSIVLATGFALGIGLFFGIYPAFLAASLNPIDALHFE